MSNRFISISMVTAFLALISVIIGVGELGLHAMYSLHVDAHNLAEQQWMDVQLANEALNLSNQNSQVNMRIFLTDNKSEIDSLLSRRAGNSAKISALLDRLQPRVGSAQEQSCLDDMIATRKEYLASYQRATTLLLQGNKADAQMALTHDTLPKLLGYHKEFIDYIDFQTAEMNKELGRSSARYTQARQTTTRLIVLSVLLAIGIAVFVIYKIAVEIRRRQRADGHLQGLNHELELRVWQRTAALEESILELNAEIAERRRNEQLVRRLSTAVEQCPVSVIITDLSGHIIYVNQAFIDTTGYSHQEAIGKTPRILKSGRTSAEQYEQLWKTIAAGNEWRGEFCNRKKNGALYFEQAVIRPIRDDQGNLTNFLALKEDITERRELQGQLQHVRKMEAIGQLAAGIAHEINTPMQFIRDNMGFAHGALTSLLDLMSLFGNVPATSIDEDMIRQVGERLKAADLSYLQKELPLAIEDSLHGIERVSNIVQAMKEFSHPGSEEKQLADINRAIETTLTVSRNEWKHVADVEKSFSDDIGLVPCHVGEFNQVILNLLVNAAHAIAQKAKDAEKKDGGSGKGKITIRTARDADYAQISIQDSGCGIPLEVQPRIFDPFFTTKELGKGTGQGLALAYAIIVKKHGGTISFSSKDGEGTTFFIRLPVEMPFGKPDPATAEIAPSPTS